MAIAKELFIEELQRHQSPVVLDIGAHKGEFSILTLIHNDRSIVHAFEPVPQSRLELNKLQARYMIHDRLVAHELALWETDAVMNIKVPDDTGLATLGNPQRFERYEDISVTCVPLDRWIADSHLTHEIKIIKIDVEGAELMVLRGSERYLRAYHPALLLEYTNLNTCQFGYEPQEIWDLLEEYGYTDIQRVEPWDLWVKK